MTDFILRYGIVIAAFAPVFWRLYIKYRWVSAHGTVVRMEQKLIGEAWGWVPTVEYQAGGRQWVMARPYTQPVGMPPKYTVGDEVEILYDPRKPSRVTFDVWSTYLILTFITMTLALYVLSKIP